MCFKLFGLNFSLMFYRPVCVHVNQLVGCVCVGLSGW